MCTRSSRSKPWILSKSFFKFRFSSQISQAFCIRSQTSGPSPNIFPSRIAMAGVTPCLLRQNVMEGLSRDSEQPGDFDLCLSGRRNNDLAQELAGMGGLQTQVPKSFTGHDDLPDQHQSHEGEVARIRNRLAFAQAKAAGLLGTAKNARLSGRVPTRLLEAAKRSAHVGSDTELLELALSRLALEDEFGARLVHRKCSIPADIDLEL